MARKQLLQLLLALMLQTQTLSQILDTGLLEQTMNDIPHVHVMLRRRQLHEDAANANARWFMQRTETPHCTHSYDEEQSLPGVDSRDSLALVIGLPQLISNSGAAALMQRAGVFFYIVGDALGELSEQQLLQVEQSCRQLWIRRKIYNRYIITDTAIYIYDPFARRDANGVDAWEASFGRLLPFMGGEPLPELLFHNMRGYPLRVQIFKSVYARPVFDPETGLLAELTGVDWEVAQTLRDLLNFTMDLQEPDKNYFGERSANGSYNGAIGSIQNDGLDICLTGFFVKDYLVQDDMDFTVAVYDDQLCIYVPKASPIPQSILPIFAVGYDIWLGFILMAFVCAFIWLLLRVINLRLRIVTVAGRRLWQQALAIVVDTWVVWVRVNLSHLPDSYAERMFIGSLCLVSVIFGAIFESSLATVYIHPLHYKDIMTMQDLDDSGLKVEYKYTSMADDLFFSETSPLFASLNKKLWWNRDLNFDVTLEVATVGGKAGVSRYNSLIMESANYLLTQRIWIVPECPKYYTISYVLPRDAPWEEAVNTQLLRLLNAGLIHKWILDQKYRVTMRMRTILNQAEDNASPIRVLTIGDLQLAFYVVIVGTLLASLGFIGEHVWLRHSLRGSRKKL
ncbi:uncharacterized protein LOC133848909 isoform X2 [Drosophila sulfurigaster albostrigata]|uniref:uncharacterized protein LOC133848909 isoform X2 n=1 Tax=Drosophila sulfurigaster albostrigata TaxID=89887 RepID=UPI002D21C13D|nr:uncharacterized protein LOC133848909 isoform X2 [Drosophila sulfurigaster albostrigata]